MNKHSRTVLIFCLVTVTVLASGCGAVTAVPSPTGTPIPSLTTTETSSSTSTPESQPHGIIVLSNSRGIYTFNIRTGKSTTLFSVSDYLFDYGSVKSGNGYIYFVDSTVAETDKDSYPNSSLDIFRMKTDGSEMLQLTNTGHSKHNLSVSPNGRYLTYTSNQNGQNQMFLMDVQSNETEAIATSVSQTRAHSFFFATWSSDSNQVIFFETQQAGGYLQLFLYNLESNSLIPVIFEGAVPLSNLAWFVDDQKIILPVQEKGKEGIYAFNVKSKTISPVFLTSEVPQNFVQSPNRDLILFELRDSNKYMKLCSLNLATDEVTILQEGGVPSSSFSAYSATWSPDSNYIVFNTGLGSEWYLNIMEIRTKEKMVVAFPDMVKSNANILWIYP